MKTKMKTESKNLKRKKIEDFKKELEDYKPYPEGVCYDCGREIENGRKCDRCLIGSIYA